MSDEKKQEDGPVKKGPVKKKSPAKKKEEPKKEMVKFYLGKCVKTGKDLFKEVEA